MGVAANLLKRRWSIAVVMVILATAGLVASVMARWTHDVAFDTEAWVEIVGPIGTSEPVTDALTQRVSQELIDWIDAEERIGALLPSILEPLAGEIGGFVDGLIVEETDKFFDSDFYERAWFNLNEVVHPAAVAIIRDEVRLGSTAGGVVTVDLVPLLTPIVDAVFDRVAEMIEWIPALVREQVDIVQTVASIVTTYTEEGLPEWLSDIEVFRSDRLAALQQAAGTLDRLVWVLPVLAILFGAGAIYFAPNRWLMGAVLAGAAAVGFVVARLLVAAMVEGIVSRIETSTSANVAYEVFIGLTGGLSDLLVILGVVAGVAAVVIGGWLYFTEERGESDDEPAEAEEAAV